MIIDFFEMVVPTLQIILRRQDTEFAENRRSVEHVTC